MPSTTTLTRVVNGPALVKIPMSEEDFLALGETKHHEYYDGMCVVNPPNKLHQRAESRLRTAIDPHVPPGYELFVEWGWRTGGGWFEPDLMIVPNDAPVDMAVEPPFLIIEVLSKWNRLDDLMTKRDKYAAGGLPWYWIVDLDGRTLTVLELAGGLFIERQRLSGPGTTVGPVRVEIDPRSLV
jgi:Uma2 family endonuclease